MADHTMGYEGVTNGRGDGHETPGHGRTHTLGLLKGHWHRGIRETLTGTYPRPPNQTPELPPPPALPASITPPPTSCTCPTCHTYEVGTRFASGWGWWGGGWGGEERKGRKEGYGKRGGGGTKVGKIGGGGVWAGNTGRKEERGMQEGWENGTEMRDSSVYKM